MKKYNLEFAFDKETPGTLRFKEVNADGERIDPVDTLVGTLYLRKRQLPGKSHPPRVSVVITIQE